MTYERYIIIIIITVHCRHAQSIYTSPNTAKIIEPNKPIHKVLRLEVKKRGLSSLSSRVQDGGQKFIVYNGRGTSEAYKRGVQN